MVVVKGGNVLHCVEKGGEIVRGVCLGGMSGSPIFRRCLFRAIVTVAQCATFNRAFLLQSAAARRQTRRH